jgi:hypothetical protein
MVGIYLIKITEGKITIEDCIEKPNFLPVHVLSEEYRLNEVNPLGYYIMPCTYNVIIF